MKSSTPASSARPHRIKRAAAAAAALAFCACGAQAQVRTLFEDDEARAKLAELDAKIAALEGNIRTLAAETVKLNAKKRELLDMARELSGLIEENGQLASRQDARIEAIGRRIDGEGAALRQSIAEGYAELRAEIESTDGELYERALAAYGRMEYAAAENAIDELLLRYPASRYAHSALFWLGQMQRDQGYDIAAQDALLRLVAEYPESTRVPDALLALEDLARTLGDEERARHWRQRLLRQHPTSAAADQRRREAARDGG